MGRNELDIIRDEMGVIYRSVQRFVQEHQSRSAASAQKLHDQTGKVAQKLHDQIGKVEAWFTSREWQLSQDFKAELTSLRNTVKYLAKHFGSAEVAAELLGDSDRGVSMLELVMEWMSLDVLSRTSATSRDMLAKADACWKPFAVQHYPELALRVDDSAWRSCFLRKRSVPSETPDTIHTALLERGEHIWKFKNHW